MLGVPTHWRELKNDAVADPALHDVLKLADVVSPWTVGRYRDAAGVRAARGKIPQARSRVVRAGEARLPARRLPRLQLANMHGGPLDAIPRRKGEFLWSQFTAAKRAGAKMIYVAMFDEVDEGTAIFKCTNDVPVGDGSKFVTYEALPSDFYLRLTGAGGKLLRREIEPTERPPAMQR